MVRTCSVDLLNYTGKPSPVHFLYIHLGDFKKAFTKYLEMCIAPTSLAGVNFRQFELILAYTKQDCYEKARNTLECHAKCKQWCCHSNSKQGLAACHLNLCSRIYWRSSRWAIKRGMTSHPDVLGRTLPGHVGGCLSKLQRGFNAVVYRWSSSEHNAYPALLQQRIY